MDPVPHLKKSIERDIGIRLEANPVSPWIELSASN